MLDHLNLNVPDLAVSRAFYEKALGPLDMTVLIERPGLCGFGRDRQPTFFISQREPLSGPVHVAFAASGRKTVDRFHAAAILAGGRDNGPPGLRPEYHENYYGAFVFDPDGNNVEAVRHLPE
jgi:catechol 2,3-dioxygenase-like lactoylglutathione lyase family enzyme